MTSIPAEICSPAEIDPPCRDFLRNSCRRGNKCKFRHPSTEECGRIKWSEKIFCHDFQNSICRRINCKFIHASRETEAVYRLNGQLPVDVVNSSEVPAPDETLITCKDFLNSICSRGATCKYRHVSLNTHELVAQPWLYTTTSSGMLPTTSSDTLINYHQATSIQSHPQTDTIILSSTQLAPPLIGVQTASLPSHDHVHFSQPPSHMSGASLIQPAHDTTILTPVNDAFATVAANSSPVVGLVTPTSYSSSNVHALYAHPQGLHAAYPSIVTVSSAPAQPTPVASSVLAMVAESHHHHNAAAAAAPTAAYLFPSSSAQVQHHAPHHILSTSSQPSVSTATLLTIPLSQFACTVTSASPMLHPQANSVAQIAQHHHPATMGYLGSQQISVMPMSAAPTEVVQAPHTYEISAYSAPVSSLTPSSSVVATCQLPTAHPNPVHSTAAHADVTYGTNLVDSTNLQQSRNSVCSDLPNRESGDVQGSSAPTTTKSTTTDQLTCHTNTLTSSSIVKSISSTLPSSSSQTPASLSIVNSCRTSGSISEQQLATDKNSSGTSAAAYLKAILPMVQAACDSSSSVAAMIGEFVVGQQPKNNASLTSSDVAVTAGHCDDAGALEAAHSGKLRSINHSDGDTSVSSCPNPGSSTSVSRRPFKNHALQETSAVAPQSGSDPRWANSSSPLHSKPSSSKHHSTSSMQSKSNFLRPFSKLHNDGDDVKHSVDDDDDVEFEPRSMYAYSHFRRLSRSNIPLEDEDDDEDEEAYCEDDYLFAEELDSPYNQFRAPVRRANITQSGHKRQSKTAYFEKYPSVSTENRPSNAVTYSDRCVSSSSAHSHGQSKSDHHITTANELVTSNPLPQSSSLQHIHKIFGMRKKLSSNQYSKNDSPRIKRSQSTESLSTMPPDAPLPQSSRRARFHSFSGDMSPICVDNENNDSSVSNPVIAATCESKLTADGRNVLPTSEPSSSSSSKTQSQIATSFNSRKRSPSKCSNEPINQGPRHQQPIRKRNRRSTTASPDSVTTDDLNYRDLECDDLDSDFYYDEFERSSRPSSSIQRSSSSRHGMTSQCSSHQLRNKYRRNRPLIVTPQKRALRAENAQLRRRLASVSRQRGDLRAAYELLLEQNAYLRQTNQRNSPSFSIGAAVAAVQHQPDGPHRIGGVYVSSPTATTPASQAPQVVAAVAPNIRFSPTAVAAVPSAAITPLAATAVQLPPQPTPVAVSATPPGSSQAPLQVTGPTMPAYFSQQLSHTMAPNPAGPPLPSASTGLQVCHYPVVSSQAVFSSLSASPAPPHSLVSVGPAPSGGVTFLLGQAHTTTPAFASPLPATSNLHHIATGRHHHQHDNAALSGGPVQQTTCDPSITQFHQYQSVRLVANNNANNNTSVENRQPQSGLVQTSINGTFVDSSSISANGLVASRTAYPVSYHSTFSPRNLPGASHQTN